MKVHTTGSLTCCTQLVSHRWRSMPHDYWHTVLYLSVTDGGPYHMIIIAMLYSICESQMEVHTTGSLTCCTQLVSHRWSSMPHDHWHAVLYLSVTDGGPYHMIIIDMLYSICQSQIKFHTTGSLTCCTRLVSHRWRSMPHDWNWHVVLYLSITDECLYHMIIDMLYSICQSQMEVHTTWSLTCCTLLSGTDGGPYHMIIDMLYSICQSQMEVHTTWSSLTCCTLFVSHRWRSIPQDHWHAVLNLSVTDGGPCNMIIEMLYSMCLSQMKVYTTWS